MCLIAKDEVVDFWRRADNDTVLVKKNCRVPIVTSRLDQLSKLDVDSLPRHIYRRRETDCGQTIVVRIHPLAIVSTIPEPKTEITMKPKTEITMKPQDRDRHEANGGVCQQSQVRL